MDIVASLTMMSLSVSSRRETRVYPGGRKEDATIVVKWITGGETALRNLLKIGLLMSRFSHSTMGRDKRGAGDKPRQVGGGVHSGDIGSNTLRPSDCSRCKYATKLTACAGCQKTSNITHCLLHCTAFNALSVNDKVSVVKSSKACAICLHPSYTSKRYDYKDKEKMFVVWMVVSLTTIPVYMATETHM